MYMRPIEYHHRVCHGKTMEFPQIFGRQTKFDTITILLAYLISAVSQTYCIWSFQEDAEDLRYQVAMSLLAYSCRSRKSRNL